MSLFEVKAEVPADQVDVIDDVLFETGVDGWSVLQDAIERRAWIVGIFATKDEAMARWTDLTPRLADVGINVATESLEGRELADQDWRDSYKIHFKAWQFGRLHWVPVWERDAFKLPAGDAVIWLDPGLAFGTGNHETTRLCVERLVALADRITKAGWMLGSQRVTDAGCGSGILALSAAKLGFGPIMGFDNDPEAVRVSEENAALNAMPGRVRFAVGDLLTGFADGSADVVLANIQADVLMRFANELLASVSPGGSLILSGILSIERDRVRDHFAGLAAGWEIDSRVMGEWSDVLLVRPTQT